MTPSSEIWAVVEQERGRPKRVGLEVVTKAKALADASGGTPVAVALGPGARQAADVLGAHGAARVLVAEDDRFDSYFVAPHAQTIAALARERQPRLILFGGTSHGRDVAARAAAKLRAGVVAGAVDVTYRDGDFACRCPQFGGTLEVTCGFQGDGSRIAILRPGAASAATNGGSAQVEEVPGDLGQVESFARIVETVTRPDAPIGLEEAEIIVSGGRGLGGPESFALIRDLADALGAAVGASRAVVDAGWIPYEHQVGQTGRTVRPKLYVACGISGAIQHKVGMQTSETIVAVNKNPDAPIFKFADLGIVGDLFDVVPKLTAEIRRRKAGEGT